MAGLAADAGRLLDVVVDEPPGHLLPLFVHAGHDLAPGEGAMDRLDPHRQQAGALLPQGPHRPGIQGEAPTHLELARQPLFPGGLRLLHRHQEGPHPFPRADPGQHPFSPTGGDHSGRPRTSRQACGPHLGHHTAGAETRDATPRHRVQLWIIHPGLIDQTGVGVPAGSQSKSPSWSVSRIRRSASIRFATRAARVSLSPKRSSSVATVSFSLMTGITPS